MNQQEMEEYLDIENTDVTEEELKELIELLNEELGDLYERIGRLFGSDV